MKYFHKFQQKEWYIENKEEIKIMRDTIVDYNVMHTWPVSIMNSVQ